MSPPYSSTLPLEAQLPQTLPTTFETVAKWQAQMSNEPPNEGSYSSLPPHLRPQYTPSSALYKPQRSTSPPLIGSYYSQQSYTAQGGQQSPQYYSTKYTPSKSQPLPRATGRDRREREKYEIDDDDDDDDDDPRYGRRGTGYAESVRSGKSRKEDRRPNAIVRRSSSHPGYGRSRRESTSSSSRSPSREDSRSDNHKHHRQSRSQLEKQSSAGGLIMGKRAPGGGHEHLRDHFSKTPTGLGAAAVGAVLGGLAARKAHDSSYVAKEKKGSGSAFLTVIGAALGGMAVNAAVDRYEEKKQGVVYSHSRGSRSRNSRYGGGSERGSEKDSGKSRDSRNRDRSYYEKGERDGRGGRRGSWEERYERYERY